MTFTLALQLDYIIIFLYNYPELSYVKYGASSRRVYYKSELDARCHSKEPETNQCFIIILIFSLPADLFNPSFPTAVAVAVLVG